MKNWLVKVREISGAEGKINTKHYLVAGKELEDAADKVRKHVAKGQGDLVKDSGGEDPCQIVNVAESSIVVLK